MRGWRTAIAGVIAGTLLMTPLPSSAVGANDTARVIPFESTASDGTRLRGDVYLPGREGRLATVLVLSPYWNTAKGPSDLQSASVAPFTSAGFAVALVNLRGTGASDGCFQWGSRRDWSDASTVITTLAAQPWSNGRVGMYGTSYEGWAQYMAMADPPPSLRAVVPISGVIDVWSLLTRRGAPIHIGPAASTVFGGATSFADVRTAVVRHAGCSEYAGHMRAGLELARSGDRTPYYAVRDLRPFLRNSRVPVLMSNGLQYLSEGHELQFEGLWQLLRPDRTRFVLGQWGHGGTRPGFTQLAVSWFDHYLRDGRPAGTPGTVDYQDDSGGWHIAAAWPPPARDDRVLLSATGLVAEPDRVVPSRREFASLDGDATGTDTLVAPGAAVPGPPGVGAICGPHNVVYVSAPLAEPVLIAGNVVADLTVASSLPGGNLVATLYHTSGDGSCADLARAPASGRVELNLRHWQTPGASVTFPVNTPTRVIAASLPLATALRAGERLALVIGATSAEILPNPLKPILAILTGPTRAGSLRLPVVVGRIRFR